LESANGAGTLVEDLGHGRDRQIAYHSQQDHVGLIRRQGRDPCERAEGPEGGDRLVLDVADAPAPPRSSAGRRRLRTAVRRRRSTSLVERW
jgi:hypothetical protein